MYWIAALADIVVCQGDELSVIRRSILEELMRGPQSPEGAQELITRAQSEDQTE